MAGVTEVKDSRRRDLQEGGGGGVAMVTGNKQKQQQKIFGYRVSSDGSGHQIKVTSQSQIWTCGSFVTLNVKV